MKNLKSIYDKLESFISKYYLNRLIRGCILFVATGFLYFLLTALVEYFLWLKPLYRSVLFGVFVLVETMLFGWLIALPLFGLFRLKKRIDHSEASKILGQHFPEVSDKLLNVIQLSKAKEKSELLLASIEQKSAKLEPIPFKKAIRLTKNISYLKFVAVPVGLFLLLWIFGGMGQISDSYHRLLNYNKAYTPPAPFSFSVLNQSLSVVDRTPFTLQITVQGSSLPQQVKIHYDNQQYFLQKSAADRFFFQMPGLSENTPFYLEANGITSKKYLIKIINSPKIKGLSMYLDYPNYTQKKDEQINNTGSATIPEGTKVNWNLKTNNTSVANFINTTTKGQTTDTLSFIKTATSFQYSKQVFSSFPYAISVSNKLLPFYETLNYQLSVIKDQSPAIKILSAVDSTNAETLYFKGQVSDDYGLSLLQLIYFPQNDKTALKKIEIPIQKTSIQQFYYRFPDNLDLLEGRSYQLFFKVYDNDAINGRKSAVSQTFYYRRKTKEEIEDKRLEQQNQLIDQLNSGFQNSENQIKKLEKLSDQQKQNTAPSYEDKQRLHQFLEQQRQHEQLMKRFTKALKQAIENVENPIDTNQQRLLKERLERQNKAFEKNERLQKELAALLNKIDKKELAKKLEEMGKQQSSNQRNLEQMLELTKRYYVAERIQQLANNLNQLADKQKALADEKTNLTDATAKQQKLNETFKKTRENIAALEKENNKLKSPFELDPNPKLQDQIQNNQNEATDKLNKQKTTQDKNEKAKMQKRVQQSQSGAAKKMKQLAKQLQSEMMSSSTEQQFEDIRVLRQLLDNLLIYSLSQEALMEQFRDTDSNNPNFNRNLRKQHNLKQMFQHVDDSLFALSLRRPEIGIDIHKKITDVYFNIEKSVARHLDKKHFLATGNQQYAVTLANDIAGFLSDVLDNMQDSMSMNNSGQGGEGFQLPDIIKKQEDLNKQLGEKTSKKQNSKQPSNNSKEGEGNEGDASFLYEIYKQQNQLRQALQNQLEKQAKDGVSDELRKAIEEMERVEKELIEKGIRQSTFQKMQALHHQLLRLDKAAFQQGQKPERKSKFNQKEYNGAEINQNNIRQYFNQIEILDRERLPLRESYKKRIKYYFEER